MAELTIQRMIILVEIEDKTIHQVILNKKEESWVTAAIAGITDGIKISEQNVDGLSFVSGKAEKNNVETG